MKQYPHMCRDGHDEVGWSGDGELCPVCDRTGAIYNLVFSKRPNGQGTFEDSEVTRVREVVDEILDAISEL